MHYYQDLMNTMQAIPTDLIVGFTKVSEAFNQKLVDHIRSDSEEEKSSESAGEPGSNCVIDKVGGKAT